MPQIFLRPWISSLRVFYKINGCGNSSIFDNSIFDHWYHKLSYFISFENGNSIGVIILMYLMLYLNHLA